MKETKPMSMESLQGHLAHRAIRLIDLLAKKLELPRIERDKATKRKQIATSHVPSALIHQMAATAEKYGRIVGVPFDHERVQRLMVFASAFEPVANAAEIFAARVRQAVLDARSEAGAETLTAYKTLKGVVDHRERAVLRDDFEVMQRIMKERRNARGHAKTEARPQPAFAPQPASQPYVVPPVPSAASPMLHADGIDDAQMGARVMLQLPGWKGG